MVKRMGWWLTPGDGLRRLAHHKTVGGLSRGRFIAVWRPLLPVAYGGLGFSVSLLLLSGPVTTAGASSVPVVHCPSSVVKHHGQETKDQGPGPKNQTKKVPYDWAAFVLQGQWR
jgi:hypothetical protein